MDRDEGETGREGCDGNTIWSDVWCGMGVISVRPRAGLWCDCLPCVQAAFVRWTDGHR